MSNKNSSGSLLLLMSDLSFRLVHVKMLFVEELTGQLKVTILIINLDQSSVFVNQLRDVTYDRTLEPRNNDLTWSAASTSL